MQCRDIWSGPQRCRPKKKNKPKTNQKQQIKKKCKKCHTAPLGARENFDRIVRRLCLCACNIGPGTQILYNFMIKKKRTHNTANMWCEVWLAIGLLMKSDDPYRNENEKFYSHFYSVWMATAAAAARLVCVCARVYLFIRTERCMLAVSASSETISIVM